MLNREAINAAISKRSIILDADGIEYSANNLNELDALYAKYSILRKFVQDENGSANIGKEPRSIKAMQRLELADYEPASDSGHFRFYPKGNLVFDLIKDWADEIALNRLNSVKIETPLLYSYDEPDIKQQVQSFHERHYVVNVPEKEKEFILRFAGDFGLFRMMKDAGLSYRSLPLRIYEYSKSFRYEKSGELTGLKRLRAFSMPDIHSFTSSLDEALSEYKELYRSYQDLARAMNVSFVPVFRVVEDFYISHKSDILELVKYGGMPVYIELLSEMKHYWVMKSEFQAIDGCDGFVQLSTVQLDVKDAEIYGIGYTDRDGGRKGCIICHSSIGSIERWMYSILEASLMKNKPELPYWLSPVQIRIIPVGQDQMDCCSKVVGEFVEHNIRADIDDRDDRLGKKIRNAEQDWVPYVLVVGSKEQGNGVFTLRERSGEEIGNMTLRDMIRYLKGLQGAMPFRRLNLDVHLSRQPIFRG